MATVTPNFGWDVPQSTDLVKDGATAIAALGNDIDTSLVDLKGGTTGQVLSKASNTDMDFTWVAQDDSNAIQNALLTTTGDTIYASSASTPARLGIGSTGQVLTVSGGLPVWATPTSGGMTLISTTTLNGTPTTVVSSIPSTYNDLRVVIRLQLPANDGANLNMRFNNDSTANRHRSFTDTSNTANSGTANNFNDSFFRIASGNDNAVTQGLVIIDIPDYANTSTWKFCTIRSISNDSTTSTNHQWLFGSAMYNQTGAISSLGFTYSAGNATSGSILLYGVK